MEMMLWIIAAGMGVLAGVLLSGRGAFLIAGYNTSSRKQKEKYDEKKLCRVTGGGMLVIAALLAVMAAFGEDIPGWFPVAFLLIVLADVIGMMYLANRKCFRADYDGSEPPVTEAEARQQRRITKGATVFTLIVCAGVLVLLLTGNVSVEYGQEDFTVRATYWADLTVDYDDIDSIEYRTTGVGGVRVGGVGSLRLALGNFRNDEFGNYTRYTYTGCTECVVLRKGSRVIVLNGPDAQATQAIYDALTARVG